MYDIIEMRIAFFSSIILVVRQIKILLLIVSIFFDKIGIQKNIHDYISFNEV